MLTTLTSLMVPMPAIAFEVGRWLAGEEFMSVLANFITGIFTALTSVFLAPFFGV